MVQFYDLVQTGMVIKIFINMNNFKNAASAIG